MKKKHYKPFVDLRTVNFYPFDQLPSYFVTEYNVFDNHLIEHCFVLLNTVGQKQEASYTHILLDSQKPSLKKQHCFVFANGSLTPDGTAGRNLFKPSSKQRRE